jgi:hypothetical protein
MKAQSPLQEPAAGMERGIVFSNLVMGFLSLFLVVLTKILFICMERKRQAYPKEAVRLPHVKFAKDLEDDFQQYEGARRSGDLDETLRSLERTHDRTYGRKQSAVHPRPDMATAGSKIYPEGINPDDSMLLKPLMTLIEMYPKQ